MKETQHPSIPLETRGDRRLPGSLTVYRLPGDTRDARLIVSPEEIHAVWRNTESVERLTTERDTHASTHKDTGVDWRSDRLPNKDIHEERDKHSDRLTKTS